MGLIARWRAYRKERSALLKMVALLQEDDRRMQRAYVQLALTPLDPNKVFIEGQRYTCVSCNKSFVHDEHSAWGFCRRCS